MNTISQIVKLSPGYKSAVNVENDLDNYDKVSSYIPTDVGARCLVSAAKALNPECKERSFLITGTYGTGKSHLALILCHLFKNAGIDVHLNPVMEKIKHKWQDRYDEVCKYRGIEDKPFVLVTLYQDEGSINDALLRKLDETLSYLKIHDLLPDTVFAAALKRIENIKLKHPDALKDLKKAIDEEGLISIEDVERRLKNYEKEAFEIFLRLHPRFSHGAKFHINQDMKASEVYVSVAKKLKEKGFAGIVVLWDEFGRYLERSLETPKGNEALELQEFAEACNDSYLHKAGIKLFTFLIAHREMQEYLGLVNARITHWRSEEEKAAFRLDIQKIQKRFHSEIRMKSNDTEIFDLIDHVTIQQKEHPLWGNIKSKGIFDIWAEKCVDAKIFSAFDKATIIKTIVEGAYPLHPVTTCCLPKLSEKVAQNERTLFQFLCKNEPKSVSEFIKKPIEEANGKLNVITPDLLLDYFIEEAKRSDKTKTVTKEYINAEKLLVSFPNIQKKIAKTIAVLNMASDDRITLPATPEFIAFSVDERLETISDALESMSSKNNGERILVRSSVDGSYRFYGAGVIDIEDEIEKLINERATIVSPVKLLDRTESAGTDNLWDKIGLPVSIEPKSYNDDLRMNRMIEIKPIDLKGLEGFKGIENDGVQDGLLLTVLCESELEIKKAFELVNGDKLKDSRILTAIPKIPINFSYFVSKYDALNRLQQERKDIFGPGAPYEGEWTNEFEDCLALLKKALIPLMNPEKSMLEFYVSGELKKGISSQTRLENMATEMMRESFPSTPLVLREELKKTDGNDTFKKHRKPVIDNIFREDGPEALAKEVNAPVKSVIEAILKANNILVKRQGTWILEKPSDNQNMTKVWSAIEDFVLSCNMPGKPISQIVQLLLSPPFGIRKRSIPVLLACPLRKYILRGNVTLKDRDLPFNKIDSDVIEAIVANPERHTIIYAEVGVGQKAIVDGMCKVFEMEPSGELGEKIVSLREKMISWWQGLPNYARKTFDISDGAKKTKERIFIPLSADGGDAKRIYFENLPESLDIDNIGAMSYDTLFKQIKDRFIPIKKEFEKTTIKLNDKILDVFKEVFGSSKGDDSIKSVTKWHKELCDKGDLIANGDAGRLLEACRLLKEKKDENILVDIASQITGTRPENWHSSIIIGEFKGQLKNIKKTVEEQPTSPTVGTDYVLITLVVDGKTVTRKFKRATSISQIGKSMANMINEAINGLGPSLSEEEKFTVLSDVLKEHLK